MKNELEELDDVSLLKRLQTSNECLDSDFWKNRFIQKYGEKYLAYKRCEINWKDYYLKTVLDTEKFSKHPIEFLEIIVWRENINSSFYIDWKNGTLTPLLIAPDWVKNNLQLLNLGNISMGNIIYENVTPLEILSDIPSQEGKYIIGLHPKYTPESKYPLYVDLENVKKDLYSL